MSLIQEIAVFCVTVMNSTLLDIDFDTRWQRPGSWDKKYKQDYIIFLFSRMEGKYPISIGRTLLGKLLSIDGRNRMLSIAEFISEKGFALPANVFITWEGRIYNLSGLTFTKISALYPTLAQAFLSAPLVLDIIDQKQDESEEEFMAHCFEHFVKVNTSKKLENVDIRNGSPTAHMENIRIRSNPNPKVGTKKHAFYFKLRTAKKLDYQDILEKFVYMIYQGSACGLSHNDLVKFDRSTTSFSAFEKSNLAISIQRSNDVFDQMNHAYTTQSDLLKNKKVRVLLQMLTFKEVLFCLIDGKEAYANLFAKYSVYDLPHFFASLFYILDKELEHAHKFFDSMQRLTLEGTSSGVKMIAMFESVMNALIVYVHTGSIKKEMDINTLATKYLALYTPEEVLQ